MKKILKAIGAIAICVSVFALTACDTHAPTLEITNKAAIRDKFTVDFTIWDKDVILSELTATITGKVDGEDHTQTQNIYFSEGEYAEDEEDMDLGFELEEFMGSRESVSFTGLEAGQKYTIVFTGTYNDRNKKMDSITATTSGQGGTVEEAHEIKTVEDFNIVRNDPDGYFKLMNDIDCSGVGNDKTVKVESFYSDTKKFVGNFDGNNKKIHNFHQESFSQYMGLFGYVDADATIKNLTIENVKIHAKRFTGLYVGIVAGMNSGKITNVSANNIEIVVDGLDDGNQVVGGFVGHNKGGEIVNCNIKDVKFDMNVPAGGTIGGFVGNNEKPSNINNDLTFISVKNSHIENMTLDIQIPVNEDSKYAEDLVASLYVGGFVGDNSSKIEESDIKGTSTIEIYSFKNITTTDYAGDEKIRNRSVLIEEITLFVGGYAGNNSYLINDCESSLSSILLETSLVDKVYVGAFIGINRSFSSCVVKNCTTVNTEINVFYTLANNDNYKTVSEVGHIIGSNLDKLGNVDVSGNPTLNKKVFTIADDLVASKPTTPTTF